MDTLQEYRRKRDFDRTPEPSGNAPQPRDDAEGGVFVIHKHAARRLHYDLRLEHAGVLESWAVPKGPGLRPGEKRLAVHVEDHPLEYGDFEGVIPSGYGAGTVMLWDRGHWRPTRREAGRIDLVLEGTKLRGAWTLTRTGDASGGKENWLLIKRRDPAGLGPPPAFVEDQSVATGRTMAEIAADRDRTWTGAEDAETTDAETTAHAALENLEGSRPAALPASFRPQLATAAERAPDGEDWLHEIKFDGYRILARRDSESVRLISRNGKDWSSRFPEIAEHLGGLAADEALLDGEVVLIEPDGRSSFGALQEAIAEGRTTGLTYQLFDLVHLDGHDLRAVPLEQRKTLLASLLERSGFGASGPVRYTDHIDGRGAAMHEHACRLGLEGIISKRRGARYRQARSRDWLKVKCVRHQELVVGGYTEPSGSRSGFGSLLLGGHRDGALVYAGRVGTGFDQHQLDRLSSWLRQHERPHSPFVATPRIRNVHWVDPELVVEVTFTDWTRDGVLRHPSFRGVREDRDVDDVVLPPEAGTKPTGPGQPEHPAADEEEAGHPDTGATGGDADRPRAPGRRRGPTEAPARSARSTREPARARAGVRRRGTRVAGVALTNPDRVLYPEQGLTKLELARYYEAAADWLLPRLADRPLSLVRCPQGHAEQCFFQKHPGPAIAEQVPRLPIREKNETREYLYVRDVADVVALVQAGVLELHVWGSRVEDVEHPDTIVFDLDPGPGVDRAQMAATARSLRERLEALGLTSFLRTTGGKGLHLVTPVVPERDWDAVKRFARGVAAAHARGEPNRLTINSAKAQRRDRIFLDYLRNGRGATAIASYSTRARPGAPVAVPVRWRDLTASLGGDRYDVAGTLRRLRNLKRDPWEDFEAARRPISDAAFAAVTTKEKTRR